MSAVIGHMSVLRRIVGQFKGMAVLVMGDPMIDYYHFGHVDRLSPEAPVPIFVEDKTDLRDGGAGNVLQNLHALGCQVSRWFPPAPYTMKHRYMVGSQQLFRIDSDRRAPPEGAPFPSLNGLDAVVISDYAKGWCTPERCQVLIRAAIGLQIPVIVDPKGEDWSKYAGATIICPNQKEMLKHYDSWNGHILHKRGAEGISVIYPDRNEIHFPARARQVFDVTGAGDTVVAVLAAALGSRAEMQIAAELANIAAGLVVGQVGTFACSAAALMAEL